MHLSILASAATLLVAEDAHGDTLCNPLAVGWAEALPHFRAIGDKSALDEDSRALIVAENVESAEFDAAVCGAGFVDDGGLDKSGQDVAVSVTAVVKCLDTFGIGAGGVKVNADKNGAAVGVGYFRSA